MTTVEQIAKSNKWNMPTTCPCCGTPLEINENHTRLYCPNEIGCKSYVKARLSKWVSLLEMKGFGTATIEDLVETVGVKNISDLYNKSNLKALLKIPGYGEKTIQTLEKELATKNKMTLAKFIAGYDIESIGETQAEKIINEKGYQTIDQMTAAGKAEFVVPGIGITTANKLMHGFIQLKSDMDKTLGFVQVEGAKQPQKGGKLEGLSFCFTGKACKPRKELEKIVSDNGGTNSGVKKGLSYLVTDDTDSNSGKSLAAKKLGIPTISSTEFLKMAGC